MEERKTAGNPNGVPKAVLVPFAVSIAAAAAFTLLIGLLSPRLATAFLIGPDQGPWWYYWQLAEPTFLSRLTSWGSYALHQAFVWVVVFLMMRETPHPDRVTRINLIALWGNLAFMALHLFQTHLFYDGIAQDVPVWSSQWSVIFMLVIMIVLLIPRRGIILGMRMPVHARFMAAMRKYHGVYISWALVYTFWFHPMVGDYGLLTGFFYMFLLFIQLSFAGTKLHRALGWIAVLELTVGIHGPAIAIQKMLSGGEGSGGGTGVWPMFAFGFLATFVLTGQFGFKMKSWARAATFTGFALAAAAVYAFRGYARLYEIAFIPAALIGGAALLTLVGNLSAGKKP